MSILVTNIHARILNKYAEKTNRKYYSGNYFTRCRKGSKETLNINKLRYNGTVVKQVEKVGSNNRVCINCFYDSQLSLSHRVTVAVLCVLENSASLCAEFKALTWTALFSTHPFPLNFTSLWFSHRVSYIYIYIYIRFARSVTVKN